MAKVYSRRSSRRSGRRPQQANYSRWGGKSLVKFARVKSGRASSASGTLVIKSSKKAYERTRRNFKNTMFMKFHFGDALNYVGGSATTLGVGSIAHLDRKYTPSSQDAKHMAWMVLDFGRSQHFWKEHPVGNSILHASEQSSGSTDTLSMWTSNTTTSTQGNQAQNLLDMLMTMDKTPASADPVALQTYEVAELVGSLGQSQTLAAAGHYLTTSSSELDSSAQLIQDSVASAVPDAPIDAPILPLPTVVSWKYRPPNHVISGFDINLEIVSASLGDQWVSVKLCRSNESAPQAKGLSVSQTQELLNKGTITDSSMFETLWQHSFFMPRMTSLNGPPNRVHRIRKRIECNLSRSSIRLVSGVNKFTTGIGGDWGAQLSPYFVNEASDLRQRLKLLERQIS